jgi:ATP synthase F1 delta subunit
MSEDAVARVYAAALFAAAAEADLVAPVCRQVAQFADALQTSETLRAVFFDPQVDASAKTRVLLGLTAGAERLVVNTLRLMLDKGRLAAVGGMRRELERMAAEAERTLDVEVLSAVPLGEPIEAAVVERVEKATGRCVRLSKRVDEAVIGGLVIRVGDVVLDASLRARVEQLRAQMQRV